MTEGIGLLSLTALSIGFLHTILGPDHYVPFLAMARVGRWSLNKTVVITLLCGLGHVLGSVGLGLLGILFGVAVLKLEHLEAVRGDIAGWLLIAFGLLYFLWGLRRAIRNRPHTHLHAHVDGTAHAHEHTHRAGHLHAHADRSDRERVSHAPAMAEHDKRSTQETMTPWILFTIFLFGPCEPLIPLLMYPAAQGSAWGAVWVVAVFGVTTLATMTAIVVAGYLGLQILPFAGFRRYSQATAGFAILACGIAVKVGF
jgi:ABC-type nickel/cobalt efflux system permease component RcnA